jgi:hypothetical protein
MTKKAEEPQGRLAARSGSRAGGAVNPRDSHLGPRPWHLAGHMVSRAVVLLPLAAGTLALGLAIYHWVEGLGWPDAFLNAAMLLGGMGPVDPLRTTAGKWLAGCYALLAGGVFLVLAGVMLAPVIHHVLQRFHLDA